MSRIDLAPLFMDIHAFLVRLYHKLWTCSLWLNIQMVSKFFSSKMLLWVFLYINVSTFILETLEHRVLDWGIPRLLDKYSFNLDVYCQTAWPKSCTNLTLTSSVKTWQFSSTYTSSEYFPFFFSINGLFLFAFLWLLMKLITFSCICSRLLTVFLLNCLNFHIDLKKLFIHGRLLKPSSQNIVGSWAQQNKLWFHDFKFFSLFY